MYSVTGSLSASTTLLSQLKADPSGELLQSLRSNLDEVIQRTAAVGANAAINTDERAMIDALQSVFEAAQDILEKAAFEVAKVCHVR